MNESNKKVCLRGKILNEFENEYSKTRKRKRDRERTRWKSYNCENNSTQLNCSRRFLFWLLFLSIQFVDTPICSLSFLLPHVVSSDLISSFFQCSLLSMRISKFWSLTKPQWICLRGKHKTTYFILLVLGFRLCWKERSIAGILGEKEKIEMKNKTEHRFSSSRVNNKIGT